ncbi:TonB-dependent receptor [Altererythrobacter aquiaggeris]|uniref:TonB-dependent receptor n=1 Tax=Aestuarierythrobacter aquiaggeris TaxID=1898396 RepID=UPI00301889DF
MNPYRRFRTPLLLSAAGAALSATPALAQDADQSATDQAVADAGAEDGIIIVTAQRRAQDLQDVPAAVTALTGAALENRQIADTNDLQNQIPNVVISTGTGTANSARIYFRGVGEDESRGAIDPAVGIYIDNVYLGRTVGSLVDLVDIEQVEVLRGPQGTLYGRNTNGGAIKISSVRPQLGETSISGEVGYANYDRISAKASVNVSPWDTGALRLSGLYRQREGYFELNPNGDFANLAGTTVGDEKVFALRGSLYGELSDQWSFLAIVDYTKDKSDPVPSSIIAESDNAGVVTDRDGDIFTIEPAPGATCSSATPATFLGVGCFSDFNSKVDAFGVSYQLTGEYDTFTISSTTAFRTLKDDLSTHISFPYFQNTDQNQFSQELLLNTNFGAVDLTAGAFYYTEDAELAFTFILPVTNNVDTESFSLFGQAAVEIGALTLTGGLRWTDESRDFVGTSVVIPEVVDSVSTDNITWTAKADYEITPDILVYATYATGFKSPGFSSDCFSPTGCFLSVDEEELDSIEAGLRTQFMDGRATFNATYFYNDYTNLQISATTGGGVFTRSNAGEARIQGVELEFGLRPVAGLDIYGNASWLDAEYRNLSPLQAGTLSNSNITSGTAGPACTNVTATGPSAQFDQQVVDCALGLELKNAPEWKGLLGFNYAFPVGSGEVFFGGDAAYEADSFALVANNPGSLVEPGFRLDARIGWRADDERWKVTVWGKNLTDREYFRATTSVNQIYAAPPLTFGIDVGFRFD